MDLKIYLMSLGTGRSMENNYRMNLKYFSGAFSYGRTCVLFLMAVVLFINANGNTAYAILPEQRAIYRAGQNYFDTAAYSSNTCGSGLSVSLSGNDNIEKAYNYFIAKKYNEQNLKPLHAAAIVGNLVQESGVNPATVQHGGGPGRGISQWTVNERWVGLLALAKERGVDPADLGLQLDYMWIEMNPGGARPKSLPALVGNTTLPKAVEDFEIIFFGAGKPEMQKRITYAEQVLAKYGGSTPVADGIPSSASGCVGGGENTNFIDGFTVYSQYDPAWKDKPYSSSTIGKSGCGPAAMAMIITNLTGRSVNPVEAANYAASQGLYIPGVGSSWSIGTVLAKQYGLKSAFIGADVAKITVALQSGSLVLAAGAGADPFTGGGHILVIRGVTADGKWKVGDSGHSDTSDKDWDPQQLVAQMREGSVYAISK